MCHRCNRFSPPSPANALRRLSLVALVCGFATGALAQELPIKIAVVDLDRVILQSAPGKELQAKLERFQAEVRTEMRTRMDKADAIRQQLTQSTGSLSLSEGAALQKQYEDAMIEIRRYQDDKQRDGRIMQERGLKDIQRQLRPVFEKIREDLGYDLILNNTPGVVVMARGKVDITDQIIEKLNSGTGGAGQ